MKANDTGAGAMERLPSIEEFAEKTGTPLRRVIKGGLLRLAPVFRTAKVRRELLLKQKSLCPICGKIGNALVDNGRETHVDHKWTTDEAANAVLAGSMDLISAYNKLWALDNLQAVHAACNFGRNKKKVSKSYPEHGTIISTRASEQTETEPVRTGYDGKIRGGGLDVSYLPVYRVETETKFYELEARSEKRVFSVGDAVQFRIEKQWAYVQRGDKEKKCASLALS